MTRTSTLRLRPRFSPVAGEPLGTGSGASSLEATAPRRRRRTTTSRARASRAPRARVGTMMTRKSVSRGEGKRAFIGHLFGKPKVRVMAVLEKKSKLSSSPRAFRRGVRRPRLRPSSLGGSPAESRPASATDSSDAAPYLSTPYDPAAPYRTGPFAGGLRHSRSSSARRRRGDRRASRVSYLEKSFSSAPLCANASRIDASSVAFVTNPSSIHARVRIMNVISVGRTLGSSRTCMSSKTRSAFSISFRSGQRAEERAAVQRGVSAPPHSSRIFATIASASIHRPCVPRQCTYAPHITVCGLNEARKPFRAVSVASRHTASALRVRRRAPPPR